MEQELSQKKKCLLISILKFLTDELATSNLVEERKESLEVAVQCIETAYEIDSKMKEQFDKYAINLLSTVTNVPEKKSSESESYTTAELHKHLGNSAMKNSHYEDAVKEYTTAINFNPNNAVYYCNRAAAYSRLGEHHEAIKDSKEAIKLDPSYGKAYGRLGIAYSNLDMYVEARQAYATALIYDPNNTMYETNLKLAQERLNEQVGSAPLPPSSNSGRPFDLSQIINNESFNQMAREMLNNPEFSNMMTRIMSMGQTGDFNIESILQAGQNLASRMEDSDPNFVENLRRSLNNQNPSNATNESPDNGDNQENDESSNKNPDPNL